MKIKRRYLIGLIALGLIILYIGAVRLSESDYACGKCHSAEKESWAVSTHKTVHCRDCHIDPGMSGEIKAQLRGMRNLWVSITKGNEVTPHEDPIPISTENCFSCHAAVLYVNEIGFVDLPDNSLKGQSMTIAHRTHVSKYNIECVECHRGVVHRNPEDIGKFATNWPLMHKDCGVCHDGKYWERFEVEVTDVYDQAKCTVCHPTYEPPGGDAAYY